MYMSLPQQLFDELNAYGLVSYADGFATWQIFTILVDGKKVPEPTKHVEEPVYLGRGCRGLGLDHRWQKSEFSERYYCHKCGEPDDEPESC